MEPTKILLILTYLTTVVFSVPIHDPKVEEDEFEEKESVRIVRNPKDHLPNAPNPTQFIFLQTKQQDYLKQRYAQQQKIDIQKIALNLNKNPEGTVTDWPVSKRRQERDVKDSQDTETGLNKHIIYVNPKILRQILDFKAKRSTQIQSRSYKELEHSLNDIIGKNPHVQLESLKRILQQSQRNTFLDHTPITERTLDIPNLQQRPNIQTSNQAVTKETFERIQKQLDEASKFQVQNALERAQQAAQAHVAAQHKAIEDTQRSILENVQKRFNDNPQALALVQPHFSKYKATLTTVPSVVHSTVEPDEKTRSNVGNYDESQVHNIRFIKVTPLPKHVLIEQQKQVVVTPKPQQFETNEYAPHHLHQTIAQLQAEKVLLQQIHQQNNAILNSNKALVKFVGEKVPNEDSNNEKQAQSTVNSYQKLHLNQQQEDEVKKIDPEEENEDVSIDFVCESCGSRVRRSVNNTSYEYDEYYEYYDDDSKEVVKIVKLNKTDDPVSEKLTFNQPETENNLSESLYYLNDNIFTEKSDIVSQDNNFHTDISKRFYSIHKPLVNHKIPEWYSSAHDYGCKPVVVVNNRPPVYPKKRRRRRKPHRRHSQNIYNTRYPTFDEIEKKVNRVLSKIKVKI